MVTGNITDYVGRTVDVLAFDGLELGKEALLDQVLAQAGGGGKVITGVQKLVQRFLLEILKERGSDPYSIRGTDFMMEARSGTLTTVTDVHGAFARAILLATINLQGEEDGTEPDDERFASAEILQVEFEYGEVRVWVRLLSRAGEDRAAIFPLDIPI